MALTPNSQMPSGVGVGVSGQASPWAWSFTNSAGTVLYVFIQLDVDFTTGPVTGVAVTYAGVSMTNLASVSANGGTPRGYLGLFRLLNPATGANNFSVTWTGANVHCTGGAISFTGNNAVTPDGTPVTINNGAGTAFSIGVGSTTLGSLILAAFVYGDPTTSAPSGTQTFKKELDASSFTDNIEAQYSNGNGGTVTTTLTDSTSTSWAAIAVEVFAGAAFEASSKIVSNTPRPARFRPGLSR